MKSPNEDAPPPPGTHLWVVDHCDGEHATIEVDGMTTVTVPRWMLPQNVTEGDIYRVKHDRRNDRSILMIVTDDEERRRRLADSARQVAVRSPNDKGGDIKL